MTLENKFKPENNQSNNNKFRLKNRVKQFIFLKQYSKALNEAEKNNVNTVNFFDVRSKQDLATKAIVEISAKKKYNQAVDWIIKYFPEKIDNSSIKDKLVDITTYYFNLYESTNRLYVSSYSESETEIIPLIEERFTIRNLLDKIFSHYGNNKFPEIKKLQIDYNITNMDVKLRTWYQDFKLEIKGLEETELSTPTTRIYRLRNISEEFGRELNFHL